MTADRWTETGRAGLTLNAAGEWTEVLVTERRWTAQGYESRAFTVTLALPMRLNLTPAPGAR